MIVIVRVNKTVTVMVKVIKQDRVTYIISSFFVDAKIFSGTVERKL